MSLLTIINLNHHQSLHAKHHYLLELAVLHATPPKCAMRQPYVAIILKRGKIISVGYNSYRKKPFHSYYSIHAEIDALNNCSDKSQLSGADMYTIHLNRDKVHFPHLRFRSAAPCHDCQVKLKKAIDKYGLRKVFYTTDL